MNRKNIALIAHDNRKKDLIEWVKFNRDSLANHKLICTGTTGRLVSEAMISESCSYDKTEILVLKSGPLGGDQQMGSLVAEGHIDMMIFLWDPMQAQPHDVDVKALLRITTLYNVPTALNRSTADFLISSPLFRGEYRPILKDYSEYLNRNI